MLCDDVRRTVYFFLDGSLTEPSQRDFADHISLCPDCETRTKVHERLRIFIIRRLRPDSAPERLKQRLSRALRAMNADWA
jgi:mycothiol system anti-sigma-R factor